MGVSFIWEMGIGVSLWGNWGVSTMGVYREIGSVYEWMGASHLGTQREEATLWGWLGIPVASLPDLDLTGYRELSSEGREHLHPLH